MLAACSVLGVQGCVGGARGPDGVDAADPEPRDGGIGPVEDAAQPDGARPDTVPAEPIQSISGLIDESDPGLEVAVWTGDDTGFAASRALAAYADRAVPIEPAVRARWRSRGLRFVSVPLGEVEQLVGATRAMSAVQRQRFGQLTLWTAVVRGPAIPAGSEGPGGEIPAGKPRLIARSWIEPDLSGGAMRRVVRIEVGIQIETGRSPVLLDDGAPLGSISGDADLIDGLVASFITDGRDAIVLAGVSPDLEWSAVPDAGGAVRAGQETEPGPRESVLRSLGERMLAAEGTAPRGGRPGVPPRKVLIVLIPSLGEVEAAEGASVNDDIPGG
ncbi:MAG: hypothetical protein AAGA55_03915 [Planctomycetota bacterium]